VPLWLALTLRSKRRCTIQPPQWMNAEHLAGLVVRESGVDEPVHEVPPFYVEVGRALLAHARADFGLSADAVEESLGELQLVRWHKLQRDIGELAQVKEPWLTLSPHLAESELHLVRPFLLGTVDRLQRLRAAAAADAGEPEEVDDGWALPESEEDPVGAAAGEAVALGGGAEGGVPVQAATPAPAPGAAGARPVVRRLRRR